MNAFPTPATAFVVPPNNCPSRTCSPSASAYSPERSTIRRYSARNSFETCAMLLQREASFESFGNDDSNPETNTLLAAKIPFSYIARETAVPSIKVMPIFSYARNTSSLTKDRGSEIESMTETANAPASVISATAALTTPGSTPACAAMSPTFNITSIISTAPARLIKAWVSYIGSGDGIFASTSHCFERRSADLSMPSKLLSVFD